MKLVKKIILTIVILSISFAQSSKAYNNSVFKNELATKPINVAVLFFKFGDPYMDSVRESLQQLREKNQNLVNFTFFDGKNSAAIQNEIINGFFKSKFDLLLINLVNIDEPSIESVINGAKSANKAVILFNVRPANIPQVAKSYSKFFILSTDAKQSGALQGKIIVDIWNNNKAILDKNNDNVLEYVMIKGKASNTSTIDRTTESIKTINNAGILTKEITSVIADWDKDLSKDSIEQIFLRHGNNIEAILANNDAMALGATEALQKYGYNTGDSKKNIIVVGIDGIPEAKALVNQGFLGGTVIQDPNELASALYQVGQNLLSNKPPLENTAYTHLNSDPVIELPYYEYKKES